MRLAFPTTGGFTLKIKCGICHSWGLFGGVVLHPQTRRPTTRCTTCRDGVDDDLVGKNPIEKTYKPPMLSNKQEENQ